MKIKTLEAIPLRIPTKEKYQMAKGTHQALRTLLVKLTTDSGIIGYGEAHEGVAGYTYETLEDMCKIVTNYLAPALIGEDIRRTEKIGVILESTRTGHNFAKCAVETAVYDALGKAMEIPVSLLLGGPIKEEIEIIGGMGIGDVDYMAAKAQHLVEDGFKTLKIKVGTKQIEEDIKRVQKVREAVGDSIKIRVDANAGYNLPDALKFLRGIVDLNIEHFEQPVPGTDLDGMVRIRKISPIPILADESVHTPQEAFRAIKAGAVDMIKIKISKAGGFIKARKIIDLAEAAGIPIILGQGICTSVESFAEIHLACSYNNVVPLCEMVGPTKLKSDIAEDGLTISQGKVQVPKGPGLGLTVKEELWSKFLCE
ncbi:MAG: enolase C-terminal domain-like protein [Dehalobacterium sp.]